MNIKNITVAIVTCVLSLGLTSINVEAKSKLTIPLDDSFHSVDYPFNSGGGVFTLVKIIEQDDKLYLCGVAHISGVETVFGQQPLAYRAGWSGIAIQCSRTEPRGRNG